MLDNLYLSPLLYAGGVVLLALLAGLLFALHWLLFWQARPERLSRATWGGLLGLAVLALESLGLVKGESGGVVTAVNAYGESLPSNHAQASPYCPNCD